MSFLMLSFLVLSFLVIKVLISVNYLETLAKILDFPANSRYLLKPLIRSWIILDRWRILKFLTRILPRFLSRNSGGGTAFSKSVLIYAFHQTPTRSVRAERILFIMKFPAEIWKNIKYEIRKTSQKHFGAKLLNQIDNVVIIQTKFGTNWHSVFLDLEL